MAQKSSDGRLPAPVGAKGPAARQPRVPKRGMRGSVALKRGRFLCGGTVARGAGVQGDEGANESEGAMSALEVRGRAMHGALKFLSKYI